MLALATLRRRTEQMRRCYEEVGYAFTISASGRGLAFYKSQHRLRAMTAGAHDRDADGLVLSRALVGNARSQRGAHPLRDPHKAHLAVEGITLRPWSEEKQLSVGQTFWRALPRKPAGAAPGGPSSQSMRGGLCQAGPRCSSPSTATQSNQYIGGQTLRGLLVGRRMVKGEAGATVSDSCSPLLTHAYSSKDNRLTVRCSAGSVLPSGGCVEQSLLRRNGLLHHQPL